MSEELLQMTGFATVDSAPTTGPKQFTSVAYSGGAMQLANLQNPVVVDLASMQAGTKPRPVLREHDEQRVVGHTTAIRNDGRTLTVDGMISAGNDHAREIIEAARNGFPWQQSIGAAFQRSKLEFVKAGSSASLNGQQFTGPLYIARGVVLKEISFVALGADDDTSATIAASNTKKGFSIMSLFNKQQSGGDGADSTPEFIKAMHSGPLDAERQRVAKIEELTGDMKPFAERFHPHIASLKASAIRGEMSESALQETLLAFMRESYPKPPSDNPVASMPTDQQTLCAAFHVATGNTDLAVKLFGQRATDQAVQMRASCPRDVFLHALKVQGLESHGMSDREMIRAAFSSHLLPTVLDNTVNKALEMYYREAKPSWEAFAAKKTVRDFREAKSIRPTFVGGLEQVGPTGEIKHGRLAEEGVYTWQVDTFARMLTFSRQDIINDTLGAILEAAPMMAAAAQRKQSDILWSAIMGNAGSFFSSGHGNLGEAGSALSVASLNTAIAAMRTQRDTEGNDLDISPAVLAVPPELETTARAILESLEVNDTSGPSGNALRGVVSLVVESRISNTTKFAQASATQWYLFGGPTTIPVVSATLDQTPNPIIEIAPSAFNQLGEGVRCYQDIGAALGDYRAAYKATGAPAEG